METRAIAKYLRVSPIKIRRIINAVKEQPLEKAIYSLEYMPQANAKYILNLLKSVRANAKVKNPDVQVEKLRIKEIMVDKGPTLKRFRPRGRGRAMGILKRTSHISVIVTDEM